MKIVKHCAVGILSIVSLGVLTMAGCAVDPDSDSDLDDVSGIVDDEGAIDTSSEALTATQQAWLTAHNKRRKNLFSANNVSNVPLSWNAKLATSAQNYADKLIKLPGCQIQHGYDGDSYGGENLAATSGNWKDSPAPTPEKVLNGWFNDEQSLPFGQKPHFTQVGWRATKYVGCGGADKSDASGACHIQVCRYIAPGNCNVNSSNWKKNMLAATSICGLQNP
jgi:hypothetical protein